MLHPISDTVGDTPHGAISEILSDHTALSLYTAVSDRRLVTTTRPQHKSRLLPKLLLLRLSSLGLPPREPLVFLAELEALRA